MEFFMRPVLIKNFILAIFAISALAFVWPTPAQAQYASFPCANGINGAGPGERVLGMGPSGMLVCTYSGEAQPQQAPPQQAPQQQWVDGYAAVVGHIDANDFWAAFNVRQDQGGFDGASNYALNACKAAMGDGCKVMDNARNGSIIIMRTHTGYLYANYGDTVALAKSEAEKWCAANNLTCTYFGSVTTAAWKEYAGSRIDKAEVYDPAKNNGGVQRNLHGAVAWASDVAKPLNKKGWVSGGNKTQAEAKNAALKLCQNDLAKAGSSGKCEVSIAAANGVIIAATDDLGQFRYWSGVDFETAEKDLSARCKTVNQTCATQLRFDTRKKQDASFGIPPVSR
jgi:hypothetical protein